MWRKLITSICFIVFLVCIALYLKNHVTVSQIAYQESSLRSKIGDAPWRSFWIGLLAYSLVSLIPGTSGKSIVCGYLFGIWKSLAMVLGGLSIAATATFLLSRYVFRDWVENKFSALLTRMNSKIGQDGTFYLLTLRMAHVPFSLVNYCSGATRVSFLTFLWTTMIGLLPGTLIFVYIGAQLPTLQELASHGAASLINPKIAAGLIAMGLFPLSVRYILNTIKPCKQKSTPKPSEKII